jgi:NDP-sugar pyrophosphorylase family protein
MILIIPMAGFGSRFPIEDWLVPKPMIDVNGKPMFTYAINSLPTGLARKIKVILRKDAFTSIIIESFRIHFPKLPFEFLILEKGTRGQAETVLLGIENENPSEQIIIHNIDTAFTLRDISSEQLSGNFLIVFHSKEDRWSYVKTDIAGKVVETAEKIVISDLASTGTYGFESVSTFQDSYLNVFGQAKVFEEEYIAPMYNHLVSKNTRISILEVHEFFCMGTPSDLETTKYQLVNWMPFSTS